MNPLVRTGGPALRPAAPWERGCTSPSVVEAGGSYKMWYTATDEGGVSRLCYAVSTDGAQWTRPEVGRFEYQGSKRNNIVSLQNGNVFLDPSASPERRFKRIGDGGKFAYKSVYGGGARFRYDRNPPATWHYSGVAGGYSPDGIHWTACQDETIMPWYTDTENIAFWDTRLKKYVAYVRWNEYLRVEDGALRGSFDYRAVARSESDDFEHFPPPRKILEPDFTHPDDADLWGGGLYDSAAVQYPWAADSYFIFTAAYHHTSDTTDIQLATSRDGIRFTRWREPRGAFVSHMLYVGSGILPVGDELNLYYSGYDQPHDQGRAAEYRAAIGRVRMRRDGFVSQDAGTLEGTLTTIPFTLSGRRLEVNLDGSSRGWLKAELLDEAGRPLPGFARSDADRLFGNDMRARVTWAGRDDLSSQRGKTVRLRFVGQSVKLYAFQFLE